MPDESPELERWRSLLRRHAIRGYYPRNFSNWIRQLYRTQGHGAPFHVENLMVDCRLDPENRRDYARAQRFLQKNRRDFTIAMRLFFDSPEFARYYNDGLSQEELFSKLVETAVSWSVFPIWSDKDDDRNYKLWDMASYVYVFERRAKAAVKEIHRKSEALSFAFQKFPSLPVTYNRPQLETDGNFIALPAAVECEICHQHFAGQTQLVQHYRQSHSDSYRGGSDDNHPRTGLDALFGGGTS